MRINEITVYSYDANYKHGEYTMSGGRTCRGQPSIVIKISTDEGIDGWSESAPLGSTYLPSSFTGELAALKELGPHIIGQDPRSTAVVNIIMDNVMKSGTAAKSLIDMACWDIFGKSVGLPTSSLLGGRVNDDIRGFGVVGFGDPKTSVEKALSEVKSGYAVMQIKVGGDPITDARRVRAIYEAIPDGVEVWADANAGWNLAQALTYVRALGNDITVPLEQPCRSLSDCAEVGRRTGLPIVCDECVVTLEDLFAAHAAGITGINLKCSRVGGFTKARVIRDAAVALEMMVTIDDTWGCALLTAQNLQLAATTRQDRLRAVDLYAEWTTPLITEVPRMQSNGRVKHSDLPGNGFGDINFELTGEPLFRVTA